MTKSSFLDKFLTSETGELDYYFCTFFNLKTDLIYLYSQMQTKHAEILLRTGKDNEELKANCEFLKKVSVFMTMQQQVNDALNCELQEIKRRKSYLDQGKVDWTKIKRFWNGHEVKYIKDFVKPVIEKNVLHDNDY